MKFIFIITFLLYQTHALSFDGLPQCQDEGNRLEDSSDFDFVEEMTWFEITLGACIVLFTIIVFTPQIYKICRRKDGEGLSPSFLVIFIFNQIFAFTNATVTNFPTILSCPVVGWELCVPQLLSWFQIAMNCLLCFPIFLLFLIYFKDKSSSEFKRSLIYFISACAFSIFTVILITCLIYFTGECSDITYYVGMTYAFSNTATTVIEYLPQIVRTYRTKYCGSMSFSTNWITTLGTAIMTFYMMFSTNQHWTTLLSFIVALAEHLVLCFLQLKYDYLDKCSKKQFKNSMKSTANVFRKCFKMELYEIEPDTEYNVLETVDEKSNLIENENNEENKQQQNEETQIAIDENDK